MAVPRIAIVCEYATLNGGERSLLTILDSREFVQSSLNVSILAPAGGRLSDALRERSFTHVPFDVMSADGDRLPRVQIQHDLLERLRSVQPDLVHANSLSMGRLLGSIRHQIDVPCVSHLRDIVGLSRTAVDDLNRLDQLLAVSRATRQFHVAQGLAEGKTIVVYNGVDTECFMPRQSSGSLRQELNLADDSLLVATIGQIGLRKGQDVLARALCLLKDRMPHVHVLFVGERNSEKEENRQFERQLHQDFMASGLSDRVHFLGYRTDVPTLLNEIDVLVHAARQEPLGRVLLEAAASGLPIVATHVGGTAEILPNDAALLIPADDPARLTDALLRVLGDAELRHDLGTRARQIAIEKFSVSRSATRLIDIWKSLLDHFGST